MRICISVLVSYLCLENHAKICLIYARYMYMIEGGEKNPKTKRNIFVTYREILLYDLFRILRACIFTRKIHDHIW